jgi:hypothetical protein
VAQEVEGLPRELETLSSKRRQKISLRVLHI